MENVFYKCIGTGRVFFLKCNYDIEKSKLKLSQFYTELLRFWSDFRNSNSELDQSKEVIWNNRNVCIDNKPIFHKKLFDLGVVTREDLMLNRSIHDFCGFLKLDKISTLDLLIFGSIRSIAKKNLKKGLTVNKNKLLAIDELGFQMTDDKYFDAKEEKFRTYYTSIIASQKVWPLKAKKLQEDLGIDKDEDLQNVFLLPHKITKETYLRSFQYKILNYIICTNLFLRQMKIINYDYCERCKSETENLYHMLFDCELIKGFWKDLENFWKLHTHESIQLNLKVIFVGYLEERKYLLNYIILLSKSYIYKERLQQRIPSIQGAIAHFQIKYETEKLIAKRNGREKSFDSRWKPLASAFKNKY